MEIKQIFCTACGAPITIHEGQRVSFCPSCGSQLYIDDGAATVNVNQNIRDEARLKELELEERRMNEERMRAEEEARIEEARKKRDQEDLKRRHKAGFVLLMIGIGFGLVSAILILVGSGTDWKSEGVSSSCGIFCLLTMFFVIFGIAKMSDNVTLSEKERERERERRQLEREDREYERRHNRNQNINHRNNNKNDDNDDDDDDDDDDTGSKILGTVAGVIGVGIAASIFKRMFR